MICDYWKYYCYLLHGFLSFIPIFLFLSHVLRTLFVSVLLEASQAVHHPLPFCSSAPSGDSFWKLFLLFRQDAVPSTSGQYYHSCTTCRSDGCKKPLFQEPLPPRHSPASPPDPLFCTIRS